jgi:hypothetical protein
MQVACMGVALLNKEPIGAPLARVVSSLRRSELQFTLDRQRLLFNEIARLLLVADVSCKSSYRVYRKVLYIGQTGYQGLAYLSIAGKRAPGKGNTQVRSNSWRSPAEVSIANVFDWGPRTRGAILCT